MIDVEQIKKLREETGAGVIDAKKALEETGDYSKAKDLLMSKALDKAAKKMDRNAGDGLVVSYIHGGGKLGTLVHVACETDFVAKTDDFKKFCSDIAMQVCVSDYENIDTLLNDDFLRDQSKKVSTVLNELIAKLGEKVEIKNFVKYSVR